jgi:hypothetical protein
MISKGSRRNSAIVEIVKSILRLLTSGSDSGLVDNVRERRGPVSETAKFSACKSMFLIATLSVVNG